MPPTLRPRPLARARSKRMNKERLKAKKEKQARKEKSAARARRRNLSGRGLFKLPAEIRIKIYYFALLCPSGPEVFVGVGSHKPTRSLTNLFGPPGFDPVWGNIDWFYSNVSENYEAVRLSCTQIAEPQMHVPNPPFKPVGLPYERLRTKSRPKPLQVDMERHWPMALQHHIHPFMACKDLYYEASAEFFKHRQFILGSSTYALAWLRKIGWRNARNIRSVRFKIHREFYPSTGRYNIEGIYWDEVLGRLMRSTPGLRVLGLQYEEGHAELVNADRFLRRSRSFTRLCRVDLHVWGVDSWIRSNTQLRTYIWYRRRHDAGAAPAEVVDMMQSFTRQTTIPIRLIEVCALANLFPRYTLNGKEWYVVSHDIRCRDRMVDAEDRPLIIVEAANMRSGGYVNAYEACLQPGA